MILARAASTVLVTIFILKPSSRWFPTASRLCVWGCTPGDCHSSAYSILRIVSVKMYFFRWGSGKSFLIELIKRKFDPKVKEQEGKGELIQYFDDDYTDTYQEYPQTVNSIFTEFIWEIIHVRLVNLWEIILTLILSL